MDASPTSPNPSSAHVLVDSGALTIGIIGSLIAAVATICAVLALASGSIVLAIILLLVAGVAGLFGWLGLREHLRWEPTELHFDEWPLALGSTNTARVRRRSKRPLADATVPLKILLTCAEEARYTVGTDTHTATAEVVNHSSTAEATLDDGVLTASFDVTIPVDAGGPTLDLSNNKVRWYVEFESVDGNLLSSRKHTLLVAARLDRSVHGIQDAPEGSS